MLVRNRSTFMFTKLLLPALLLLLTVSACSLISSLNPTPTPASGIVGTVTEGPICPGPVHVGNNPCPNRPYQASITILDEHNHQVAQIQTNADGYFKLALPAGTYILHPISGNPLPRAADQTVTVNSGQYTQVAIVYDTGIR
jgi:hypothetical protein